MARAGAAERERGLAMLREGRTLAEVAEAVGVHRATVARWKAAGVQAGAAGQGDAQDGREPTEAPQEAGGEAAPTEARPRPAKTVRRMSAAFYLPVAMVARLDAMAEAEGVAVSAVAERLLAQALGE